jgi:DHA2 family multidrug resistance protein
VQLTEDTQRENRKGYLIMVIGLFMAILDIQIVASSLGEIQASLSASLDEISWVQTAYLIAEVIMIPLTSWLVKVFSTRNVFSVTCALFTIASAACAFAWNLESMIVFRAIQGFFGGALIPTVFSSIFLIFPKSEQGKATILAGLVATMAPTLGPTLGGWITNHFSWQWLFLINIIPGVFVSLSVLRFVHIDRPQLDKLKNFDFIGFGLVSLGLGCLETILKNGSKKDWFESSFITSLSVIAATSFLFFIYQELRNKSPLVELRAFKDPNFSIGCFLSFGLGVGLFGCVYLMPVFLTTVKGFNSLQIGLIMCVTGVFQFFSGPLAGILEKKMDPRLMLSLGISCFGIGTLSNGFLTPDAGFDELFWPQAIRGLSIMLCFLPMTTVTLGRLSPENIQNASGLYNLMRNLGGAIGIALIDTYLRARIYYHKVHLSAYVTHDRVAQSMESLANSPLASLSTDPSLQETSSLMLLSKTILHQSLVRGFNDTFMAVGIYLLASLILMPLVRRVAPKASSSAGH